MKSRILTVSLCAVLSFAAPASADSKLVTLLKTPNHGIQPQAVMDAKGTLHLLYFQGDPKGGNLWYVRRDIDKPTFSVPLRVNSQDGSAIAIGTIRGGQLAVGKNGCADVAWNGSGQALPKNPLAGVPMLYARLDDAGTAFEPQRNLMTRTAHLDGGGTVAADGAGNVYVAWHAMKDREGNETNRQVWLSISKDDGQTLAPEKPAWDEPTGACGCCGMRGFADAHGDLLFLYRAATAKINRGMVLLRSADQGQSFTGVRLDNWKIESCPMSAAAFAQGPSGLYAAWENDGQIYFVRTAKGNTPPKAAPGPANDRRLPALAVNKDGTFVLVWTEGTGWNRGGTLAWQVYDKAGNAYD